MQIWEDDLWIVTIDEYSKLPDGLVLESINGNIKTKGTDEIDLDTRGGYIAWGVRDPFNHALKDLFLLFMIKGK